MQEQKNNVHILSWPKKDKAMLEHSFNSEKPCPVSIRFEEDSADVRLNTSPKQPMHVAMNMKVGAEEPFPVSFRLGESICASSEYAVGFQIFDHHVATVRLKGLTKLFGCGKNEVRCPGSGPIVEPKRVCVGWNEEKEPREIEASFTKKGFVFESIDGSANRIVLWGYPDKTGHLVILRSGLNVTLPFVANKIEALIGHYKIEQAQITAFNAEGEIVGSAASQSASGSEALTAVIEAEGIHSLELVSEGYSEAMLQRLCAFS